MNSENAYRETAAAKRANEMRTKKEQQENEIFMCIESKRHVHKIGSFACIAQISK